MERSTLLLHDMPKLHTWVEYWVLGRLMVSVSSWLLIPEGHISCHLLQPFSITIVVEPLREGSHERGRIYSNTSTRSLTGTSAWPEQNIQTTLCKSGLSIQYNVDGCVSTKLKTSINILESQAHLANIDGLHLSCNK